MRSLALAFALAFALVLPGCATTGGLLSRSNVVDLVPSPLSFGKPVAMAQPTAGAEPNVAVLPDGTIFITAVAGSQEKPNALNGAAWLWRSKDNGSTWTTLRSPQRDTPLGTIPGTRRPFGSSDADVTTSADGWVYYTDWWIARGPVAAPLPISPGNYLVERSHDDGATWESAPVTTLDAATSVDRQWLVAGENGTVGLFYAYFHPAQNAARPDPVMSIQSVWSRDHGASWSAPVAVVPPQSLADDQIAHPRYVGNHTFVMPLGWTDDSYGADAWKNPGQVRLYVSRDDGASWVASKVADVPHGFDNLWAVQGAADATGRVYVAWAARTNDTMTIFESDSSDLGATWGSPIALRAQGLNFLPWVAARPDVACATSGSSAGACGGDGQVSVGWYGGDSTGDATKADANATWWPFVATRSAPEGAWAVGKVGDEPVKTGPLCPKGAACGADREILDYLSLAYAPDGKLVMAFAKSRMVSGAKAGQVMFASAGLPP